MKTLTKLKLSPYSVCIIIIILVLENMFQTVIFLLFNPNNYYRSLAWSDTYTPAAIDFPAAPEYCSAIRYF
jgi:hypothetical protein